MEIKARAWDGKKMHYNIAIDNMGNAMYWDSADGPLDSWSDSAHWETFKPLIKPILFTGLKDKNEKDIFHHDIIEIKLIDGTTRIGEVKWWERYCGFYIDVPILGPHCICFDGSYVDGVFVIGNIYENPDLLKGGK